MRGMHQSGKALLAVQDLTVRFGGLTAVHHLSFDVQQDEVVGLIGPNGAGKTTVFNAITGFVRPSSASIHFAGKELVHASPHVVARAGLLRTFQKQSFFPTISVYENVRTAAAQPWHERDDKQRAFAKGTPPERVEELLRFVGLWGKRDLRASVLPYGEQRLLGVAVVLAARPRMLLLDEPCAGMTPAEIDRMIRLIADLRELHLPMVVVEHQMRFTMGISDRVVVLDQGQKLAEGTPEQIRENPEVIEAYLGRGVDAHKRTA
jgi:branched-chain amino acid transport system ATP-binding protein